MPNVSSPIATADRPHFHFLDLLKAVGANLIVLHHLAFYGPMADFVLPLMPDVMDFLADEARIAVQVFLVVGGFLAARSLTANAVKGTDSPLRTILRRYLKLAPPFLVATLLAALASVLADTWMDHDSISSAPGLNQLVAHALLLHTLLDYESLAAGAWYVAIDFQLYVLLTLMFWGTIRLAPGSLPMLMPCLIIAATAASLMYFNLHAEGDAWAAYFFGSYGLGVLACWAVSPGRTPEVRRMLAGAILLLGVLALIIEFRSRILLALLTALALVIVYRGSHEVKQRRRPVLEFFGRISYSLFLVHFAVCLVINAAFMQFMPHTVMVQTGGMLLAWVASLAGGAAFYYWVEKPLGSTRLLRGSPSA